MLKVSAFYLEKQKSFITKKIFFRPLSLNMPREIQKKAFAVLIFSEGFDIPLSFPKQWEKASLQEHSVTKSIKKKNDHCSVFPVFYFSQIYLDKKM